MNIDQTTRIYILLDAFLASWLPTYLKKVVLPASWRSFQVGYYMYIHCIHAFSHTHITVSCVHCCQTGVRHHVYMNYDTSTNWPINISIKKKELKNDTSNRFYYCHSTKDKSPSIVFFLCGINGYLLSMNNNYSHLTQKDGKCKYNVCVISYPEYHFIRNISQFASSSEIFPCKKINFQMSFFKMTNFCLGFKINNQRNTSILDPTKHNIIDFLNTTPPHLQQERWIH